MFETQQFDITSAESMISGFALAISNGMLTREQVRNFVSESVNGDETITNLVMEKTEILLECQGFAQAAFTA